MRITLYPSLYPEASPLIDWTVDFTTESPITTVATSRGPKLYTGTDSLLTHGGLGLQPDLTILGITATLTTRRLARVVDHTIQWRYKNGQLIGENRAVAQPEDHQVYGGATDLWGIDFATVDYTDPEFQLLVKIMPHPDYPCSVQPVVYSLRLDIDYE